MNDVERGSYRNSTDNKEDIPLSNPPPQSFGSTVLPQWPKLEHLHLSRADEADRRCSIGGSDANILLSGDAKRVHQLWLEKRGEAQAADLSTNLSVMLGCWTEVFNRQWFERLTGKRISDAGRRFTCGRYDWRSCTVDGLLDDAGAIWEAKHTSAFAKPEEVLERYMPQLQHNMPATGYSRALSR